MEGEQKPKRRNKNIKLNCPSCKRFSLMPILERRKEKGKVRFKVSCRACGHTFESGPNPNLWRAIKAKYKLSPSEVRQMQSATLERFLKLGSLPEIDDAGA